MEGNKKKYLDLSEAIPYQFIYQATSNKLTKYLQNELQPGKMSDKKRIELRKKRKKKK